MKLLDGEAINYTTIRHHFEQYVDQVRSAYPELFIDEKEPITIHRLRHTFATIKHANNPILYQNRFGDGQARIRRSASKKTKHEGTFMKGEMLEVRSFQVCMKVGHMSSSNGYYS